MDKITLVTGLWDIGRGNLEEGWSRSYEHYLNKLEELLRVDCNLIIYGDENLKHFVNERRDSDKTQFILRDLNWFKSNDYYETIQTIRTNPNWYNQVGWLKESTQSKLDMYNPLVMSKMFLLHDAKILDKFNSDKLFWIDAGITNTVHSGYFTHDDVLNKIKSLTEKFLFICFPYETNTEIHGFNYEKMCELSTQNPKFVCRGGFFGGNKDTISEMNSKYYSLMMDTLKNGLMGTEESLFTIMTYLYPNLIDYCEIESNGLLYRFFEDVKNETVKIKSITSNIEKTKIIKEVKDIGLYVISFNSPKQFETLIDSMLEYDTNFLNKTNKFLLNNSTDLSTTEKYLQLCDMYGFVHIKKDRTKASYWSCRLPRYAKLLGLKSSFSGFW